MSRISLLIFTEIQIDKSILDEWKIAHAANLSSAWAIVRNMLLNFY